MGWKLGTFLKNQNYHKETMTNYFEELNKIKPFDSFTVSEKFYEARKILSLLPQAIEEAQYHESLEPLTYIWNSLDKNDRKNLNQEISKEFPKLQLIYWLPRVKKTVEKQNFRKTPGGNGHVYFVLFDARKFISQKSACGIYVGQSRYTPETRLNNHLNNQHASSIVRDKGKFILKSVSYRYRPISIKESKRLEARCIEELKSLKLKNLPSRIIKGG